MTLTQLRYIVAVAEEGLISAAAKKCFVSQPALSAGLRQIEEELDVVLFERSRSGARITTQGIEVVRHAQQILDAVTHLKEASKAMNDPMWGHVRLGVIATCASSLLPQILPGCLERYPKLQLSIKEGLTDELLEEVRQCRLDAAIVALPYDVGELATLTLFEEPFWLLCHREHPLGQKQDPVSIEEFSQWRENLLLLDEGHCLRDHTLKVCALRDQHWKGGALRATSLETLKGFILSGLGYSLFPALALHSPWMPKELVTRPLLGQPNRVICFVVRPSSTRRETLQILATMIRETITNLKPLAVQKCGVKPT